MMQYRNMACSHLDDLSLDYPDVFRTDISGRSYSLYIADARVVSPLYCPYCGGHGEPSRQHALCQCSQLADIAESFPAIVVYDSAFSDYSILLADSYLIFRYCPACGGRLASLFREVASLDDVLAQIESTYKQLPAEATLRELELVLGPPSVTGKILFKYDDSTEALVDVVYYDEFMPGYTVGFNPKNNGGLESVIVPSPNPATLPRNGIKWRGNW